jgi:phage protein D
MSDFADLARYADMHLTEYADQITNLTNSLKAAISPEMLQQRRNAYAERAKIAAVIRTIASDPALSAAVAERMGEGG